MSHMIQKEKLTNTFENLSRPRTMETLSCSATARWGLGKKTQDDLLCERSEGCLMSIYHYGTHFGDVTPMNDV